MTILAKEASKTVCIAARSQGMLLLASDRMITAGDVQFEPEVEKLTHMTPSIAVMFSGDADLHTEIFQDVMMEIVPRIEAAPNDWLRVKYVAERYQWYWKQIWSRQAESKLLVPLGLTHSTFLTMQNQMNEKLVNNLAADLMEFELHDLETIISGIDLRHGYPTPTMYVLRNGILKCADSAGFVAIGSGTGHAESQLMLARHSYKAPNGEALLNVFMAKRAAEIAPGVGSNTDIFALGPNVGQSMRIEGELLAKLESECTKILAKDEKVRRKARSEINRYVADRADKAARAQTTSGEQASSRTAEPGEPDAATDGDKEHTSAKAA